jgi:hypothetical protein
MENGKPSTSPSLLVSITGGQGTLNLNPRNPESDGFAYVTYQVVPQDIMLLTINRERKALPVLLPLDDPY